MPLLNSPRPIRSVLIANRGEIALRVMRTCARLGIRTIAVYSDADARRAARQRRRRGHAHRAARRRAPAISTSTRSSRRQSRAGADAIHPGYGFLSENAGFVRALRGRRADLRRAVALTAVERMGSKIESKRIAEAAGVPTVPGYHGDAQDRRDRLPRPRGEIGFPVLIKASAGGGGRGMRRVDRAERFRRRAGNAAKAEAEAAFGDGAVLLEKFILNPRHLEVQLAGDRTAIWCICSSAIARSSATIRRCWRRRRRRTCPTASAPSCTTPRCKLGRAIGYDSAGTVEFIMDAGQRQPYFLEMNTRLQVEHPVTEFITGIDLVEWQLLAAAGEKLPLTQDQIRCHGHAIEARITAERADLGFQPVTGELSVVDAPRGLRFDTGVAAGSQVSLYYDSLLAKLIAHGADRSAALARLDGGLVRSDVARASRPRRPSCATRSAIRCSPTARRPRASSRRVSRRMEARCRRSAAAARRRLRGLGAA